MKRFALLALTLIAQAAFPFESAQGSGGQLKLTVVDSETGKPIPCRMHLRPAGGKAKPQKGVPNWHDHFVFPGEITLRLPKGHYTFEIERGPEYVNSTGHFTMDNHADDQKTVTLRRAVNMAAEGWWSADLHVHRAPRDLQLLMQAEDLHMVAVARKDIDAEAGQPAPTSPVRFEEDQAFYVWSTEDERAGNAWLLMKPAGLVELPPYERGQLPLAALIKAREDQSVWIDSALPFAADLPIALALGLVDSIGLANDHMLRDKVNNAEGEGRKRDAKVLGPPFGNALWSQQIYYHVLNAGFRIPPSGGSGSGVSTNPVGYNRMYVYTGEQLEETQFWNALRAGNVTVTNGPLIRPSVRGQLPGSIFEAPAGEELSLDVTMTLSLRDPLSYLEIIKNGEVERSVPLREWAKTGSLDALVFQESGWFLIRAVTDVENTYRFASTGPYYVQFGGEQPRVSKASAEFFLNWTRERVAVAKAAPSLKGADLSPYDEALKFWERRVAEANAP